MGVIAPRPSVTQAAKMMMFLVLALAASAHGARLDKQGIFSVVKFAKMLANPRTLRIMEPV